MSAGDRDKLISFVAASITRAPSGEKIETWDNTLASEWARVSYGTGMERRQAAQEQGQQAATFEVNSNSVTRSITLSNRILLDGRVWGIIGASPDTPTAADISFTAVFMPGVAAFEVDSGFGTLDFSDPDNSGLLTLFMEAA